MPPGALSDPALSFVTARPTVMPSPIPAAAASTSTTRGRCRAGRRRAGASEMGVPGDAGVSRQSGRCRAGASTRLIAAARGGARTGRSCREASAAAVGIASAEAERSLSPAGPRSFTANSKPGRGPSAGMTQVRHIMGIPIGIDIRDPDGVDVEPAFDWLRDVDAVFSTYRDDSDISRLDRGELTVAECRPEVDEVLTRCVGPRPRDARLLLRPRGRPPRPVRPGQGLGGRRRRRPARRGGRRELLHQRRRRRRRVWTPRAGSPVADRHPAPGRPRPARRRGRGRGPRRRHLRRVRAAGAHPRSPYRPADRPGSCRSPSSGRTSGRPTPTPPRRSPWAPTAPTGPRRSRTTTRCASPATTASWKPPASPVTA